MLLKGRQKDCSVADDREDDAVRQHERERSLWLFLKSLDL